MNKEKYYVDGYNYFAATLPALKHHIYNESDQDKKNYNGACVLSLNDPDFYRIVKIVGKRVVFARK